MRARRIAESLIEDAFADTTKLKAEIITVETASQLYASIGGIEANIGVGLESSISSVRSESPIVDCSWS